MLKITKRGQTLMVSKGAFKSVYSRAGWAVVDETPVEAPQEPAVAPGEAGDSNTTTDLETGSDGASTAPDTEVSDEETLAKMSDTELKQYASLLGIKTKDLKTREQLMEAIQAHQE